MWHEAKHISFDRFIFLLTLFLLNQILYFENYALFCIFQFFTFSSKFFFNRFFFLIDSVLKLFRARSTCIYGVIGQNTFEISKIYKKDHQIVSPIL